MTDIHGRRTGLVFRRRAVHVPADMRLSWRLSLTLLMLLYCRGQRGSLAKLHILNAAVRSEASRGKLLELANGEIGDERWEIRVEPAFGRNLDFLIGAGLATPEVKSGRLTLILTGRGSNAAKVIRDQSGLFDAEKRFLSAAARALTEQRVTTIVKGGGRT